MTATEINASTLLTILGLVAAVWAVVPSSSRMQFRFCLKWFDWTFAIACFVVVHYIVFAAVLKKMNLYFSFGLCKWGFDESTVIYLIILIAFFYFLWRTQHPSLVRGRMHIFHRLVDNRLLTKRYDELVQLIYPQLLILIQLSKEPCLLVRWINKININHIDALTRMRREAPPDRWPLSKLLSQQLTRLSTWLSQYDDSSDLARSTLKKIVTSPGLTRHVSVTYPDVCLVLLGTKEAINTNYIGRCLDAMLDVPDGPLYIELMNNTNTGKEGRLELPEDNRLLYFFFADASAAVEKGLAKAIGDAVCRRLVEDSALAKTLNGSQGSYQSSGRFRCPINSGITLFEIMVQQGVGQRLQDHMWLSYFKYFLDHILKKMFIQPEEGMYVEYPTPFHYLLARLFCVATGWVEQSQNVVKSGASDAVPVPKGFDCNFISKHVTEIIGRMLRSVVQSSNITDEFKRDLLEIVVRSKNNLQNDVSVEDVFTKYRQCMMSPEIMPDKKYMTDLLNVYTLIEYEVKSVDSSFESDLQAAIASA